MASLWLGIDIGGSKLAWGLAEATGRVLRSRRRPAEATADGVADVRRIAADARALLREAGVEPRDLAGAGVAAPGPLEADGVLLEPPNLPGWGRVPLREILEQELGIPVAVDNDANAGALAEWRFGAGQGASHLAFLTMSTGIGAGLVLAGRPYRGAGGNAGELGHSRVEWPGEACGCGRRGCLEAYCGGASWTRRLREQTPAGSRVAELAGGRALARPEHLLRAAREGDAFALAELERYNGYLARGLVNLVFTLAPEAIVLGTIPSAAGEALCLGPVRERVRAELWPVLGEGLRIVPAALGESGGTLAGVCVALAAAEERG